MSGTRSIGTLQTQTVTGNPTTWQTSGFTLASGFQYTATATFGTEEDDVTFSVARAKPNA